MTEIEKFEIWAKNQGYDLRSPVHWDNRKYVSPKTMAAWEGWQGCAKVVAEHSKLSTDKKLYRRDYQIEQKANRGDWLSVSKERYENYNPAFRRIHKMEVSE